jgi:hypothetical protein
MKHLVHGVAFVAILGLAPPLWAQAQGNPPTATTPSVNMPAPSQPPAASENRPKRQVRRARRYAHPYPYGGYDPWGSPSDHVANELNRGQLQGGWYGGGMAYPYAPYGAPYAPRPYYPWGY